jgi:HK97 family phage portal protein
VVSFAQRLGAAVKQFVMAWSSGASGRWWSGYLGRTRVDYANEVGEAGARVNSIVAACLDALARMFGQAPVRLEQLAADGEKTVVRAHPFLAVLRRPNPYYTGKVLLSATVKDRRATGNAYWLKERAGGGRVIRLWYVPSFTMAPVWPTGSTDAFLTAYEYKPGDGKTYTLEPSDVVHFRQGIDPDNVRSGLGALTSLYREIATDDEAANWTAAILKNAGVPSVLITPDQGATIHPDDVEPLKSQFGAKFSGDRRGEPAVLSAPLKVQQLAFNPEQLNVRNLRRIPEERIAAVIGIPAIVAGLGAGLDRATYSNASEAQEMAYENTIIPMQAEIAEDLSAQLLPDFVANADEWEVSFDLSEVRVLQEDQNAIAERAATLVKSGILTIDEGRQLVGLDELAGGAGQVMLIPVNVVPTPFDQLAPELTAPAPAPSPNGETPTAEVLEAEVRALLAEWAPRTAPRSEGGPLWSEEKAARDVGAGLQRLRTRLLPPETAAIHEVLTAQQRLVIGVLQETAARDHVTETKALDIGRVVSGVRERLEASMRQVLARLHRRTLEGTQAIVADGLGVPVDLPPAQLARYLARAGGQIAGITDTTLAAVRQHLQEGVAAGETVDQLAARLQEAAAFSASRAALIARTEIGTSSNLASLASYDVAGVERVRITDGTDHDEACAELNGQIMTLAEAEQVPPLEHPNCVRAFHPLAPAPRSQRIASRNHELERAPA